MRKASPALPALHPEVPSRVTTEAWPSGVLNWAVGYNCRQSAFEERYKGPVFDWNNPVASRWAGSLP